METSTNDSGLKLALQEATTLRFFFINTTIYVTQCEPLSFDRIEVWRAWLEKNYPGKKVIFI